MGISVAMSARRFARGYSPRERQIAQTCGSVNSARSIDATSRPSCPSILVCYRRHGRRRYGRRSRHQESSVNRAKLEYSTTTSWHLEWRQARVRRQARSSLPSSLKRSNFAHSVDKSIGRKTCARADGRVVEPKSSARWRATTGLALGGPAETDGQIARHVSSKARAGPPSLPATDQDRLAWSCLCHRPRSSHPPTRPTRPIQGLLSFWVPCQLPRI